MLDIGFSDTVKIMKPAKGSRKSATAVDWEEVLDQNNEPVRIECRIMRRSSKQFSTQMIQDHFDATLLFKVDGANDITLENLVVDEFAQVYKVTAQSIERAPFSDDVYKRLTLKETDKSFPAPEVNS